MAKGRVPKVYSKTVTAGTTYAANTCDIAGDVAKSAKFCEITNFHDTQSLSVKLNGRADAIFTLEGNQTQVFNWGDLLIDKVQFDNSASGAATATVEVIVGY